MAHAQEAVLIGTVTDSTGAVLPGVTVTAVHEATGNRFVAVTDERGAYRIPTRVGSYQVTAELQGFSTVTRSGLTLAGRTDGHGRSPDGAIDGAGDRNRDGGSSAAQRQHVEPGRQRRSAAGAGAAGAGPQLDVAGDARAGQPHDEPDGTTPLPDRNVGRAARVPAQPRRPERRGRAGYGGQPRYSQDSIAEFQFISNRFDATQGRSSGVQVRAITRSGTNALSGSVRGNFRDSRFNAENPVLNRVVPIDNQQLAFTVGGPHPPRSAALLRALRVRARAADERLEHAVPRVQCRAERKADGQDGRHAPGLSALTADAHDGEVLRGARLAAVRRRQHQSSRRDGLAQRSQSRVSRRSSRRCLAPGQPTKSRAARRATSSETATSRPGPTTGSAESA